MSSEEISHIVVIGGGQAGGYACKALRGEGYSGRLTVVADEPHDFYERPPLSKGVVTGEEPLPRLFSEESLAAMAIEWQRPKRATAIDRQAREVLLSDGQRLPYDRLLIATGSRPRLPVAEWGEIAGVMTLRSWEDAQRLKGRLETSRRLGVIGGGWIGLEVASSARKLGLEVVVFERQQRLCERSVGAEVSTGLAELHHGHGVDLQLGCQQLALFEQTDGRVAIEADGNAFEPFDLVVVGTGVSFNLELARDAGLAIEQGIVVDAGGRTSDPYIFAAGDVAQHPQLGLCLQSWSYAQNQARVVAETMLGLEAHYDEPAWLWSDQHGVNIQILGVPRPGLQAVVRHEQQGPVFCYLDEASRLVQMVAFDQPRAIKLGKRWIATQRALDPAQLADPAFNLMTLR
ncbi:FAD-dependent oxidoreductase [Halomonas daqingensis]|uniref:NAD(P)/FAD-dependent oxidoreductase n=1 Tax=Billgrantia desiderata TaxID=52021 RepID=UPI000A3AEA58|nr:FAD-dependent oxidoreductase [Halomonas desiderata]MCE8031445.1 FAD-dependent oxidoreductase [Halomonas desiderata]OUE44110.1 pyridine nucleotide-disulfide oxidoreductase [Halomonas desiderata SP1]